MKFNFLQKQTSRRTYCEVRHSGRQRLSAHLFPVTFAPRLRSGRAQQTPSAADLLREYARQVQRRSHGTQKLADNITNVRRPRGDGRRW